MICTKWAKTCKSSGMVLLGTMHPAVFYDAMIERAEEEEDGSGRG